MDVPRRPELHGRVRDEPHAPRHGHRQGHDRPVRGGAAEGQAGAPHASAVRHNEPQMEGRGRHEEHPRWRPHRQHDRAPRVGQRHGVGRLPRQGRRRRLLEPTARHDGGPADAKGRRVRQGRAGPCGAAWGSGHSARGVDVPAKGVGIFDERVARGAVQKKFTATAAARRQSQQPTTATECVPVPWWSHGDGRAVRGAHPARRLRHRLVGRLRRGLPQAQARVPHVCRQRHLGPVVVRARVKAHDDNGERCRPGRDDGAAHGVGRRPNGLRLPRHGLCRYRHAGRRVRDDDREACAAPVRN
eukprot:PhM_4_TR14082/c1_g1_i1/m.106982